MTTKLLYRPVGPEELQLIRESGYLRFPPRLPEQPIFYPVLYLDYAIQIARDWNVKASGSGFVTQFHIENEYIESFSIHIVGGAQHAEYWIPAEELGNFNDKIVGKIEIVAEFYPEKQQPALRFPEFLDSKIDGWLKAVRDL